jgi:hypothetical protein
MTAGCSAVPPNALLRGARPISGSQLDLELIELVPLGVGALSVRNRQQLLQANTRGNRLRFVHGRIIASIDEGAPPAGRRILLIFPHNYPIMRALQRPPALAADRTQATR